MPSANETADDPLPPLRGRAAVPGVARVVERRADVSIVRVHEAQAGSRTRSAVRIALVNDEACSRFHAKVWLEGDHLHVHDLDSHSGTFVNGVRIEDTHDDLP